MNHRIIILGSSVDFLDLVQSSKQRGYYTIICDGYENGVARKYADKCYTVDVRDTHAIAEICITEKADGIIASFSDLLFEKLVEICEIANLPCYQTSDMLPNYRDKSVAKTLFHQLGIHTPKNIQLNAQFKDGDLDGFHYPLVVKPLNGYGSKGIFITDSIEEIHENFADVTSHSTESTILVEEYSQGKEYNMMSWVADDIVYPISIANREKTHGSRTEFPVVNRIVYPAKECETIMAEATQVLQKFRDYTNQHDGPLSMQFFYTEENGVEVCEIAGRFFGYEHNLVTYCCGLKVSDLLLDLVYDKRHAAETMKKHTPYFNKINAGLYMIGHDGMQIDDLSFAKALLSHPNCIEGSIFYKPGEIIDSFGPQPYLVRYYITADTREELDDVTDYFFKNCSVLDKDGKEIVFEHKIEQTV